MPHPLHSTIGLRIWSVSLMFTTGETVAQVSIRWLLQTPPVTSVIVGATKIHQLEDNMGAAGWRLTQEVYFRTVTWRCRFCKASCSHCTLIILCNLTNKEFCYDIFYRLQQKLRKGNVFISVCQEFRPQRGCIPPVDTPQADTPLEQNPLPPSRRPLQRTVHILLECIHVHNCIQLIFGCVIVLINWISPVKEIVLRI